jgi:hypothetical protein
MMCDVPPTAAFFCRESIGCCLAIVSRFFKTFIYNSRGPSDYWHDKAFRVPHSLNFYTSIFYFNFLSASVCITFLSDGTATYIRSVKLV